MEPSLNIGSALTVYLTAHIEPLIVRAYGGVIQDASAEPGGEGVRLRSRRKPRSPLGVLWLNVCLVRTIKERTLQHKEVVTTIPLILEPGDPCILARASDVLADFVKRGFWSKTRNRRKRTRKVVRLFMYAPLCSRGDLDKGDLCWNQAAKGN